MTAIFSCVVLLSVLAAWIIRRWYVAYRAERQLNVDELLRRGFRQAHKNGWVKP